MSQTIEPSSAASLLERLLKLCLAERSSDLHLAPDHPPYLRTQGVLGPIEGEPPLSSATLAGLAEHLSQGGNVEALRRTGALDGALSFEGCRFRYNVYRRGGGYSIALRRLEDRIRTLRELGLSDDLYRLAEHSDGLVLLAGPTGSGKSTTLATLIDRINQTRRCHIVTIEDPIEYLHYTRLSLVNQRQIGTDASSFNDALVASLRQDPDVILVGEIRDLDTIRTAITAAETGHLVFSTVHAGDCVGAIDRLVAVFPSDEQPGIRRQLSMVLRAIVAQHLLVADGSGGRAAPRASPGADEANGAPAPPRARLVLASEALMVNPAVANLIAQAKDAQIYSMMETGGGGGMYTLEENLARLWQRGDISERTATALARSPKMMLERAKKLNVPRRT
jgi:twitching motility protein PilT